MGYLKQYLCNSTCKQKTLSSMLSKILSLQWQVARVYIVAFNMKILLRILMPSAIFTYFKSLYKLRYTLHNIIVEHIHAKKLVSTTKCPVSWCDTNNEVIDHERNLTKRLLLIGYSDTITHVTLNTKYQIRVNKTSIHKEEGMLDWQPQLWLREKKLMELTKWVWPLRGDFPRFNNEFQAWLLCIGNFTNL